MKVADVMTQQPIVAEVPGRRDEVLRQLVQHDVSGLPVVEAGTRRLAGVITRSDIFRNPEEEQTALLMTKTPYTCTPEDELADAARSLVEHKVHGLPVVTRRRDLVGVLSPTDILRVLQEGFGEGIGPMVSNQVAPVHESTPLPVVWSVMNLTGVNALPVLNSKARLVGIVADSDLFKKSQVDEASAVTVLGLGSDRDKWSWDAFRSLMPLYYATSRVELPEDPVRDIMTREVQSCSTQTTVAEAARKMLKHRVQQLPVIDADDSLLGMVTDLDLLRVVYEGKGITPAKAARFQKRHQSDSRLEAIVEPATTRRSAPMRHQPITIPPLPASMQKPPEPPPLPKPAAVKKEPPKPPAKAAKPPVALKALPKKKPAPAKKPPKHVSKKPAKKPAKKGGKSGRKRR